PECEVALAAALPAVQSASGTKAKKVARQLSRLDHRLKKILDHSLLAPGKKRPRLYKRARAILRHTLAGAQVAGSRGILGVPLGPIQIATTVLLLPPPVRPDPPLRRGPDASSSPPPPPPHSS